MELNKMDMQDKLNDGYHALMLSYASGCLDEAQSLIVATHLSLSHKARETMRKYERLGGAILEHECRPISMNANSLDNVLGLLDGRDNVSDDAKTRMPVFPDAFDVPDVLNAVLDAQRRAPRWKALYPGLRTFELDLDCKLSRTRFLKAAPALKTPHHSHGGIEITLVLNGAFEDETGQYSVGDMVVTDEDCHHTPVACASQGCVCMVVSSTPIKLTGLAKLLNPFIRV